MDSYDDENQTFIKAITAFKRLGAYKFKVSIDNIFVEGITSMKYLKIFNSINVARSYGVKFIRINDTLGWLKPAETLTLCSALVYHYPNIIFSLNTYNDRGLALSNIMMSLQSGFQMLESSLVSNSNGYGSMTTAKILGMCSENNIKVGKRAIDKRLLGQVILPNNDKIIPTAKAFFPLTQNPYSSDINKTEKRHTILH